MNDPDQSLNDFLDESLFNVSIISEPETAPQSVNIDLSNGSPLDSNDFVVVHYNIDSILAEGRIEQLALNCKILNVDCLVITESKLDNTIPNNLLQLNNFHEPLRHDRNRNGGGCLIYIAENLTFKHCKDNQSEKYEHLWVDVRVNNQVYTINALYRPSTDNTSEVYTEFLTESEIILSKLNSHKSDFKIIASDLNFGNIYSKYPILNPKPLDSQAPELFTSFGFTQLIDIPTRVRENTISLVDLFFINNTDHVKMHGTLPPIADHDGIFASFHCIKLKPKPIKRTVFDYKNSDENGLINYIKGFNFDKEVFSKPVKEQAEALSNVLINARSKFIPTKEIIVRPEDQPWTNKYTRLLIRKKNRNYQIFKRVASEHAMYISKQNASAETVTRLKARKDKAHLKSKAANNESTKANRRAKLDFYNTVNQTMKNHNISAKKKFSILTKLMKTQKASTVPPIMDNNTIVTNAKEKCELFNDFFASKATVPGPNDPVPNLNPRDDITTELKEIFTSHFEVGKLCRDIKKSYSSYCGIPGKYLSIIATPVSFPLTRLFNNMFKEGIFPDIFKIAHICCIYKRAGLKSDISNWRPVSLLPTLSKVAESVMHNRLLEHFLENNVISDRQAAYLKGDSTIQQVLYIVHIIRTTWTKNKIMQGVYLDVSAAFDKAWHPAILAKLEQVKIKGKFLDLFQTYLSNRKQIVVIDGCKSQEKPILAGVPQGSRLGPLLWILYINDIIEDLESEVFIFADDTCMFAEGKDAAETAKILNRDLERISTWATKWKVQFNPSKTKHMVYSNKITASPQISFNNSNVDRVFEHKHLGIWLTPTLCWSRHVQHICSKANSKLAILRSVKYLSRSVLDILYKQQIRSVIDYGLLIFYTTLKQADIVKLNRIQYRSARLVTGALPFTSRIKLDQDLGWEDLSTRAEMLGLSLYHKIAYDNVRPLIKKLMPQCVNHTRNNRAKHDFVNFPKINNKYDNSFFPFFTRAWNNLPKAIRNTLDTTEFKEKLKTNFKPIKIRQYKFGPKVSNSLLCQLRVGRTFLNADSYAIGLSDTDLCLCGLKETVLHFFNCPLYEDHIQTMNDKMKQLFPKFDKLPMHKKLKLLLYGHNNDSVEFDCRNITITFAVQNFILATKRFQR
jgi:hypothetical protein